MTKKKSKNQKIPACSERSAYSIASGASNSSYGNSSTATVSGDISEDMMPDDFDGAYGKFEILSRSFISVHLFLFSVDFVLFSMQSLFLLLL